MVSADDRAVLPQNNTAAKASLCPAVPRPCSDYAWARSDHCPFMEAKTFCSNCKVHCYRPEMREQIRASDAVFRPTDAAGVTRRRPSGT